MLHGYCIRSLADQPPESDLRGIDGNEVREIAGRSLTMWVSRTDSEPASVERLREHENVVRRALRSATPIPLRFGTVFGDDDQVRRTLVDREPEFLQILARVEGMVEMSVRISGRSIRDAHTLPSGEDIPPRETTNTPGRAHLEARRRSLAAGTSARRAIDALLDSLEAALADLALPTARGIILTDPPFGTLAHLVRRTDMRAYRDRIAQIQRSREDIVIVATGPWAPYSFVG